MHSSDDEAVCDPLQAQVSPDIAQLDRVGLLGCLAIDSLYNVFHPSDPVACVIEVLSGSSGR